MIAFEIFGRPIYWYGLMYLTTFAAGYGILYRLPRSHRGIHQRKLDAPKSHDFVYKKLDDLFIACIIGILIGGRLGRVFLYERPYYSQHLGDIWKIHEGGINFFGGILGVMCTLVRLTHKHTFTRKDFVYIGDCILLIVPIGSSLGRIANYLNQELIGRPISQLSTSLAGFLQDNGLTTVYNQRDTLERVNVHFLQSFAEGILIFIIVWSLFLYQYTQKRQLPGVITATYFLCYGIVRYAAENLKQTPAQEMYGILSVGHWMGLAMIGVGILTYIWTYKQKSPSQP